LRRTRTTLPEVVLGFPEPAIKACETALRLLPQEPRLKYQLARAHQRAGQWAPALRLLTELVASQYVAAFDNLAWLHANGQGTPRNEKVALSYFHQAAARGHAESMYSLYAYFTERQKPDKAEQWLRQAAERGYQPAREKLARGPDYSEQPKNFKEGLKELKEGVEVFKELFDKFKKPKERN
jgi:TPR repeat protein